MTCGIYIYKLAKTVIGFKRVSENCFLQKRKRFRLNWIYSVITHKKIQKSPGRF